jgi:hypothetical protein
MRGRCLSWVAGGAAKSKDCWHFSNAATPLLRSTMFLAAPQLRLDHAPQQADEMCHNLGVCRVFKGIPVNDGSGVSSRVYGGREGGVMGSLAAGGTQRCNPLPLEVENAGTTTPKQPAIASETLDLAQGFPSGQGAPFLARGNSIGEKP